MNPIEIMWEVGFKLAELAQKLYQQMADLGPLNLLASLFGGGVSVWLSLLFMRK